MGFDDKIKNKTEELTGKTKEKVGDLTNDERMQAEGKKEETLGEIKQAGEKVKDAFK